MYHVIYILRVEILHFLSSIDNGNLFYFQTSLQFISVAISELITQSMYFICILFLRIFEFMMMPYKIKHKIAPLRKNPVKYCSYLNAICYIYFYRYTKKKSSTGYTVYAILLQWPKAGTLTLGAPQTTTATVVSLLGYQGNFDWSKGPTGGIEIKFPLIGWNMMPCKWAWVLKLDGISN